MIIKAFLKLLLFTWWSIAFSKTNFVYNKISYQLNAETDSVKLILEQIYDTDQEIRSRLNIIESRYGMNSPEMDSIKFELLRIDSINFQIVKGILEEYGFLGISDVGEKAMTAQWLVIQHSQLLEFQKEWLPVIWRKAEENEAYKHMAAMLEDRVRIRKGMKQLYGTQKVWNDEKQKFELAPVEDEKNLDTRRKEVGLPNNLDY